VQGGRTIEKAHPGKNSASIDRICERLGNDRREYDRARRRRFAATYRRDVCVLLEWTFPGSRAAVTMAEIYPENVSVTRALCRRLYRDLRDARALPTFFRRRAARIETLRDLYSAECRLYAAQRSRDSAQAAMNGFLNSLAAE
jgi:hypothetical protein